MADANVQKELDGNYIVVIVDVNAHPDVAEKYNVFGTPTTVVIDPDGNQVYRLEGYEEADKFLDALKEI